MDYQDTSRAAWEEIRNTPTYTTIDARILALLAACPQGLTDDRMEQVTGIKHQTISGNRRHLAERGLVLDSGRRELTRSGRSAIVWVRAPQESAEEATTRGAA